MFFSREGIVLFENGVKELGEENDEKIDEDSKSEKPSAHVAY